MNVTDWSANDGNYNFERKRSSCGGQFVVPFVSIFPKQMTIGALCGINFKMVKESPLLLFLIQKVLVDTLQLRLL